MQRLTRHGGKYSTGEACLSLNSRYASCDCEDCEDGLRWTMTPRLALYKDARTWLLHSSGLYVLVLQSESSGPLTADSCPEPEERVGGTKEKSQPDTCKCPDQRSMDAKVAKSKATTPRSELPFCPRVYLVVVDWQSLCHRLRGAPATPTSIRSGKGTFWSSSRQTQGAIPAVPATLVASHKGIRPTCSRKWLARPTGALPVVAPVTGRRTTITVLGKDVE